MLTFYAWDFKRSNRIPKMMDPKNELINKDYECLGEMMVTEFWLCMCGKWHPKTRKG